MWAIYLTIVISCMVFSSFFSACDLIYGVVDQDRLIKEKEKGNKRAKVALKIAQDYEWSISSILFGNSVVNIIASSFVTLLGILWGIESWIAIAFGVLLIIFCEFLPKAIAKRFNYPLSKAFAYPVVILKYVLIFVYPISKLFALISKLFKKRSIEEDKIDEDVLTEMVDEIEEKGMLEEGEAELVRSAIDLNDIQAFEIMTPRVDVFAINVEDDIEQILKEGEIFIHSRIPVYKDTIDNIIGILPIKALLCSALKGEKIDVLSLCYQPIFIPRNHQILDLLDEFKSSKVHIAVIVDEYGGTEGIITMEDILEEIVGDIFDETDEIEEEYQDEGNGVYIVDGAMNIEDFFALIGYEKEFETDYSTVGGLVQEILDRFAKTGDEFTFDNRYKCKVLFADEFTVEKLKVIDTQYEEIDEED
ncbi:MAG: hemolysin family protein [Bacilli bacterium]|nr:hemolysin family protein [Bacilli bacterium]